MSEAFEEAAMRHWQDGVLLEKEKRLPNADHLFGFAAECALKTALRQLSAFAPDGELSRYYRAHINELWDRIQLQSLQKRYPQLMALLKRHNPFHDWSVDHRYESKGILTEEAFIRHRDTAKRLMACVGLGGTRSGS